LPGMGRPKTLRTTGHAAEQAQNAALMTSFIIRRVIHTETAEVGWVSSRSLWFDAGDTVRPRKTSKSSSFCSVTRLDRVDLSIARSSKIFMILVIASLADVLRASTTPSPN